MAEKEPKRRLKKFNEDQIKFMREACENITILGRTAPLVAKVLKKLAPLSPPPPPED